MKYKKIPLEEQFKKLDKGLRIHPEYNACAIRAWAEIPISVYLGGDSEEGKLRRDALFRMLCLPPSKEEGMTYRDVAEHIALLQQQGEQYRFENAVRLLAAPLAEGYEKWKEAQKKDAKDTT